MDTTTSLPVPSSPDRRVPLAVTVWALVALGLGTSGILRPSTMPMVPLAIFGLFLASVLVYRTFPSVRAYLQAIDLRIPIAYHALTRIPYGTAFLVLMQRGELDPTFATRAGIGDIAAGVLAIAAVISLTVRPRSRALPWLFGVVGLLDMLVVIATANWVLFFSGHPEGMYPMQVLPYSVIPFFVVPMILATHVLVIARLRARPAAISAG